MTDVCRRYRPDLAEMKKMMLELGDVIESMKEDIVHRVVDKRKSLIKRKREGKDGATGFGSRSSAKSMSRPSSGCGNIHNIVTSAVDGLKPPCARRLDVSYSIFTNFNSSSIVPIDGTMFEELLC